MFPMRPLKPTFKSYLPPLQTEVKKTVQPPIKKLEAKLLPGEIVVNEVNFVRKCIAVDSSREDLWGKLICTNFKVSFITHDTLQLQKFQYTNRLLGEHDIPLACVEQVVTVNDAKGKQKVLGSNQKLKFNPTELIIYCKDFRIVRFRFDEAGPESAKKVCLAVAHYSHPADPQLLFGFEFAWKRHHSSTGARLNGVDIEGGPQVPLFDRPSDWDREIKRTGASEWRVCSINEGYAISPSLPEYFVVPVSLADQDLKQYSGFFAGQRLPLWCWNHPNGSALVRMASIKDPVQQRKLDQRICTAITKSHPKRSDVLKSDLDKSLPNIQDIQTAFVRLRQICVIEPFEESEERWLSSMEGSRWLEYVRAFLKHAAEVVYMLEGQHASVILQEDEDRDLSCVISSLVLIMLDPHYRSLVGFQGLVQREWVMAGHRFLDRCNHLKKNDKEESPLFLLLLDCVWQLLNQYPTAFEFTETYLTVLSDSMWIPIFSTFLFNCPRQRAEHCREFVQSKNSVREFNMLRFPCVWDWDQQFSRKDQALFNSPLYVGKGTSCIHNGTVKTFRRTKKTYSSTLRGLPSLPNGMLMEVETLPRRNSLAQRLRPDFSVAREAPESPSERFFREWLTRPADPHGLLLPQLLPSHLRLWKLYFLRWVPETQIPRGGPITAFHRLSLLADEIEALQAQLRRCGSASTSTSTVSTPNISHSESSRMYFKARSPDDLSSPPEYLTSSFPFSPVGNLCRRNILGTPFSKFLSGAKIWLSTETLASETL
ncbi:myotubularin-related protein 10-like [Scleropages formosus]|uniref:Myotubularin related protein 10 n=1 Tax=Scleropages formosus TaxID=113540 RepID=A0A0N8K2T6_SCLFO|nr:myotubularin-related protein 10-like [Scleropages formosus]KPP78641.1 myotubularin-related protein 10-like [Scleropages formosus]